MRINHNISAINTYTRATIINAGTGKSLEKLSSGLRINKAGDDAAGLAISEKMRGQIRGLNQAARNAQDAISLVQTAEGGLSEIHSLTQRGRELSVQAANDTLTNQDRESLQEEISQIKLEINRIAYNTEFNTTKLLNVDTVTGTKQQMLDALPGMLQNAEKMIQNYFGLSGDGAQLSIYLDDSIDGAGGRLAYVSAMINPVTNEGLNLELHIDMSDFTTYVPPNGSSDPYNYLDRTLAHEIVHAVFDRTLNMDQDINNDGTGGDLAVPKWFNEGSAEYIKGGADRLWAEVENQVLSGTAQATAVQNVVNAIGDGQSWGGTSMSYAAAYAAAKFLDTDLQANGSNYQDFLNIMYDGGSRTKTVDQAFADAFAAGKTSYNSMAAFITDFKGAAGQAFVNNLYTAYNPSDVGAIGGVFDADTVVDDTLTAPATLADPMTGFTEIWPVASGLGKGLTVQIGANVGQNMLIPLVNANSQSLGLSNVDIAVDAQDAIDSFNNAITRVSAMRSAFGAVQNRLEHTINNLGTAGENLTAAEARIRDVDMAKEMLEFTKNKILSQAAQSMLAQANQQPQGVLQLLR